MNSSEQQNDMWSPFNLEIFVGVAFWTAVISGVLIIFAVLGCANEQTDMSVSRRSLTHPPCPPRCYVGADDNEVPIPCVQISRECKAVIEFDGQQQEHTFLWQKGYQLPPDLMDLNSTIHIQTLGGEFTWYSREGLMDNISGSGWKRFRVYPNGKQVKTDAAVVVDTTPTKVVKGLDSETAKQWIEYRRRNKHKGESD